MKLHDKIICLTATACMIGLFVLCLAGCVTPDVPSLPLPTTTTTTIPPANAVEMLQGFDHPAKITHALTLTGMYKDKVTFSCTPSRSWREGAEPGCHGEAHLFVFRNGKWIGGKFDHIRNGTVDRDFNNIRYNDYQIWKTLKPVAGEIVAIILINYEHTERTNAIFAEWK